MFNKLNKPLLFTIILLTVFNFFFWQEKLGVNLLIFILLSCAALFILNQTSVKKFLTMMLFSLTIFACSMVVFSNSVFSQISSIFCFIILVGYIHQPETKAITTAIGISLGSFIIYPYNILEGIRITKNKYKIANVIYRYSKLVVLPLICFMIFYSIYVYANPLFSSYSVSFWDEIRNYVSDFFINYPFVRFMFLLLGSFLVIGFLYNRNIKIFVNFEKSFIDKLLMNTEGKAYSRIYPETGEPKNEFPDRIINAIPPAGERRTGIILIAMVNVLLLILNIIDIRFTWFSFDPKEINNLAYYVHEGTYALIFSIVLSMAILLFFFRGGVNFFEKNKPIKYFAYLWIIQNAVMTVSVAIRNYHYIEYYYALSYKRIGVMIFLILTFIGLVTMFLKITNKWTLFKLVKVNCWAVVIVFLGMSAASWDVEIAKYNLSNPNIYSVDIDYLLNLSDDSLPVLQKHSEVFDRDYTVKKWYKSETHYAAAILFNRIQSFKHDYQNRTWLSYNFADANAFEKLVISKK